MERASSPSMIAKSNSWTASPGKGKAVLLSATEYRALAAVDRTTDRVALHSGSAVSVRELATGSKLAVLVGADEVWLFASEGFSLLARLQGKHRWRSPVYWSPDGMRFVTFDSKGPGNMRLYEVTGNTLSRGPLSLAFTVEDGSWSPDGRLFAAMDEDKEVVRILDASTWEIRTTLQSEPLYAYELD